MRTPIVLFASTDRTVRDAAGHAIAAAGMRAVLCEDGDRALRELNPGLAAAVFALTLPGASGAECLAACARRCPHAAMLALADADDYTGVVRALSLGAAAVLPVAPPAEVLLAHVRAAMNATAARRERDAFTAMFCTPHDKVDPVAVSVAGRAMRDAAERASAIDMPVVLRGPSGSGRATLARSIHRGGMRASGPFIEIDAATVPQIETAAIIFGRARDDGRSSVIDEVGLIDAAETGTLLVRHAEYLPPEALERIAMMVRDGVATRVGGASQRGFGARLMLTITQSDEPAGDTRFDAFNGMRLIDVPGLDDRVEDIVPIAAGALRRMSSTLGRTVELTPEACDELEVAAWPEHIRGLVRTLGLAAERAEDGLIRPAHLHEVLEARDAAEIDDDDDADDLARGLAEAGHTLREIEREVILATLTQAGGNRAEAARRLGVSEKTIYNKIRRFGLVGQV